jgi:D-alanyl-D-alanine carboxypeptidase
MAITSIALLAFLVTSFDADARTRRSPRSSHSSSSSDSESGWREGSASIVVDAKTGKVLQESNADKSRHPASLTKIMTLYMLFEQIEAGRIKLESKLTISQKAADQSPSKLDLDAGDKIEVEDAIKAIVTRSANDVACAIGENISGSEEVFAAQMTRKARALGMMNTTFRNASGLPDKEQITTARDLAILGRAVQDRFPRLYRFFSLKTFMWRGTQIANHNRLITRDGVDGIKTGYTRASGFNLVTSVKKNDRAIVAVVLGGRSAGARDAHMRDLIDEYMPKAYAGERKALLVAEASEKAPVRVAAIPASRPAPGSREPIRPMPVRTVTLSKTGELETIAAPSSGMLGTLTVSPFGEVTAGPSQNMQVSAYAAASVQSFPVNQPGALPSGPAPASRTETILRKVEAAGLKAETPPSKAEASAPLVAPSVEAKPVFAPPPVPQNSAPMTVATIGPVVPQAATGREAAPVQVMAAVAASPAPVKPAIAPAARAGWHIQIGAYTAEPEAQSHLQAARSKLGGMLSKAEAYTEKTIKGSVEYVRARFAGFHDEAEAKKACEALKKNDFACMAVKN